MQKIIEQYINFIKKNHPLGSVVVFDGYPDADGSTKSYERARRGAKKSGTVIHLSETTKIETRRENF